MVFFTVFYCIFIWSVWCVLFFDVQIIKQFLSECSEMPKNLCVVLKVDQLIPILAESKEKFFQNRDERSNFDKKGPKEKVLKEVWNNQEKYFKTNLAEHGLQKFQLQRKINQLLKRNGPKQIEVFQFESSRKSRSSDVSMSEPAPSKIQRENEEESLTESITRIELNEVKKELEELKSWKEKVTPLVDMFARYPRNKYSVGSKCYEIGLNLLADAHSATDISRFFASLAEAFPFMIGQDEPGVKKYGIPSHDTFTRIRSDVPYLTDLQTSEWLENKKYKVTVDSTTTNRHSHKLLGMGLISTADGEFHCLKSSLVTSKTSIEMKGEMMKLLPDVVKENMTGIVSDTDRTQKKANRLVLKEIAEEQDRDLPANSDDCSLHSYGNQFNRIIEKAPADIKTTLMDVGIVFGSSIGTGFHAKSLREELADYLQYRNLRLPGIWFKSEVGSRFNVKAANSLTTILYRSQMIEVLRHAIQNKEEARQKRNQPPAKDKRWENLLNTLENNWQYTLTYLGMIVLCDQLLLKPYEKAVQINLTVNQTQEILKNVLERYELIIGEDEDHYERLVRLSILADLANPVRQALRMVENSYKTLTVEEKKTLDEVVKKSCENALIKFNKDNQAYLQLQPSNDILPTSNRPQEAFFSHFKVSHTKGNNGILTNIS